MATTQETPAEPVVVETTAVTASPMGTIVDSPEPLAPATPAGAVDNKADPDIPNETQEEAMGVGTEGEVDVWEARYSIKNFFGRFLFWGLATLGTIGVSLYLWGYGYGKENSLWILGMLAAIVLTIAWLGLARQVLLAKFGHFYRLTNRRVFVSTGVFRRREDQMELLRVQDVFVKQNSLFHRILCVGTVALVPNDKLLPNLYLTGVEDPQGVMDLVWHHARAERDRRSVKVDQI